MAETVKRPQYQLVDEVLIPKSFPAKNFQTALNYRPRDDDIFVATYPKCGTTWMQNIVILLLRQGEPMEKEFEIHYRSPFIDKYGTGPVTLMPRPGPIKTHLPFNKIPYNPKSKYIYVARNPKDCCVSFYYQAKQEDYEFEDGTFEQFFEAFMEGKVEYNDYFDHLISWYQHKYDPNVFFTTYEDLKINTRKVIAALSRFLELKYSDDEMILDKVLLYSSFDYMSKHGNKAMSYLREGSSSPLISDPNIPPSLKYILSQNKPRDPNKCNRFVRKGKIGDWRDHFSEEQSKRLEKKFMLKTKGTDIINLWSDFDCLCTSAK